MLTVCAPVRQGELRVVRAVYGVCGKVIQPRAVFGAVEQVQAATEATLIVSPDLKPMC